MKTYLLVVLVILLAACGPVKVEEKQVSPPTYPPTVTNEPQPTSTYPPTVTPEPQPTPTASCPGELIEPEVGIELANDNHGEPVTLYLGRSYTGYVAYAALYGWFLDDDGLIWFFQPTLKSFKKDQPVQQLVLDWRGVVVTVYACGDDTYRYTFTTPPQ